MTASRPNGALFGISHIQGLATAYQGVADYRSHPVEIPPWSRGEFSTEQGCKLSFVVGWWDRRHIGDWPTISGDGIIHFPQGLVNLSKYIPVNMPVFFQLSSIDAYAGDELINFGPYDIGPKWDFSIDGAPAAIGRCPVRKSDVDKLIQQAIKNVMASCVACKALLPGARLYYVFPPPPVEPEQYIIDMAKAAAPRHISYLERYELLLQYGVRPFAIRQKLITLANDQLKQQLRQFSIDYVDPPAECLLASGALDTAYAQDMHHGNEHYNKAMVNKIVGVLQSISAESIRS